MDLVRLTLCALGAVCLAVGVAIWLQGGSASDDPGSGRPLAGSTGAREDGPPTNAATNMQCHAPASSFRPATVAIAGVARSIPVIAAHRDDAGVPGVPPLTDTGKHELAWDSGGIRPGERHGHVLMNAHTWPDGSALGNALLGHLHVDDLIVVRSAQGARQCYRVAQRLDVPFPDTPQRVVARYYASTGEPRLALIACSGRHLGPGDWTQRTLWFARPVA